MSLWLAQYVRLEGLIGRVSQKNKRISLCQMYVFAFGICLQLVTVCVCVCMCLGKSFFLIQPEESFPAVRLLSTLGTFLYGEKNAEMWKDSWCMVYTCNALVCAFFCNYINLCGKCIIENVIYDVVELLVHKELISPAAVYTDLWDPDG